jgi:hypothetical protein
MSPFAKALQPVWATLFTGWTLVRWVYLGLGAYLAYGAIAHSDGFSAIFGTFLLMQALTGTGCCGTSGCATPARKTSSSADQSIEFEEIKK